MNTEIKNIDNAQKDITRRMELMNNSLQTIQGLTGDISRTTEFITSFKRDIALIDRQLDAFVKQAETNLEKFKIAAPIVQQQLQNTSNRMDNITFKILESDFSAEDYNKIKGKEMLIRLLAESNESFNNMIVKLFLI